EYDAGDYPLGVAVVDVNGDGKPDITATDANSNTVSVLLGNGDGTFQSPTTYDTQSNPSWLAAADLNGDGQVDLAVPNYNSNSISVLLNSGTSTSPAYTIDKTAPNAPNEPDLPAAYDSGASNTDNITKVVTPVFSGSGAEPGATVTLYDTDGTT